MNMCLFTRVFKVDTVERERFCECMFVYKGVQSRYC